MENRFTEFLKGYQEEFIKAGKELDKEKIPQLTEELFSEYERTGNRLEYENVYFKRRKFLTVYAMLSIMYGNKGDLSRLEEVVEAICTEECWALPAHVDRSEKDWQIVIDLFAAETAFSLAEIIGLLENQLSVAVCEKARSEIFRRVLNPFMESGFPYSWWETSKMNWCAVCCGSVGAAAIWLMQKDREKLDGLLKRINTSIMNYIDGFSDDGACLEGLGYYTYGMSFFVSYADLMYRYSDGTVDLFENVKLKNIALFQQKCFLTGSVTVSFSDSQQDEKYRVGLTAYLSKRYSGVEFPDICMAADLESDTCYRYIVLSRDFFWTKQYIDVIGLESGWHTVLPYAQWSICKSYNDCVLAAKGGHNDEPHNHNDVGSFIYACDGESVLDDLGAGEYTKDYFNENRYKNICCRSLGHNVPLIDGKEQYAGAEYKASRFVSDGDGKTEMDIGAAYGLGEADKVTRRFLFERDNGTCTVIDSFTLSHNKEVTENLITVHEPVIKDSDFVIKTRKNKFIINVTNGKKLRIINKTYTDHYGVKKEVWLMQWKVSGECTKIVVSKMEGKDAVPLAKALMDGGVNMHNTDYEWADKIAEKIYEKMKMSAQRSKDKIPYLTVDGIFDDWSDRISWWTNGFYGGQLWQLYHAYGDELFRQAAENIENKLDGSLMNYIGMDHDSGFKWLLTSVANYKLTNNEQSKNRGLLAAANLAGRWNLAGNFIRAWNDGGDGSTAGWAIIDCMMNLPLLYWAERETEDPRFSQIAKAHANTAMKAFVRENGSVNHIVQFDVHTGEIIGTLGGQGKEIGSSWTRGQAWAVYGFTLSYIHSKDEKYLETAKKVAAYFASCIPESGLIPVDFCQDAELDWEDSTAAAIAACGMLEIEKHVTEEEKPFFHETAMKLLKALEEKRSNWDTSVDYILENGSVAYHDKTHNFPIVYGDYFFTEAIFKLCDKELFMW